MDKQRLRVTLGILEKGLTLLFFVFLTLGFDAPPVAGCTLLAAAIHEGGHYLAFLLMGKPARSFRLRPGGFRMRGGLLSFREEMIAAASGPAANLLSAVLFLVFLPGKSLFPAVSLFTALTNLIPLPGYDGAVLLGAVLEEKCPAAARTVLRSVSLFFSSLGVFISLSVIGLFGSGFWLFFAFFASLLTLFRPN